MIYDIIVATNLTVLAKAVQEQIDKGWKPLGAPFVSPEGAYAQAMLLVVE